MIFLVAGGECMKLTIRERVEFAVLNAELMAKGYFK